MPRIWFWFASSFLLVGTAGAFGALVREKVVEVSISPTGRVEERTRLTVEIEAEGDRANWSSYAVYLDDHRELKRFEGSVTVAGRQIKAKRKSRDTVQAAASGTVYGSQYYEVMTFSGLDPGAVLRIEYVVEVEPYYPTGQIGLLGEDRVARLEIVVDGASAENFRWRLTGPPIEVTVDDLDGGVRMTGSDLPELDFPELGPAGSAARPLLRYGFASDHSWRDIGEWYQALLESVPSASQEVTDTALELIDGTVDPRQRLEALLGFMRQEVRYAAVEIGIGGFRPSSPEEVLERKWGDCKDKSLLLIELLRTAGLEAHPALILAGSDRRIDRQFPAPTQFNHAIVAVESTMLGEDADDPLAGGFVFIDPTQTYGSSQWLQPAVQDQDALIVLGSESRLVRTPIRADDEHSRLDVDLEVREDGSARGQARLQLRGWLAASWIDELDGAPVQRRAEVALGALTSLLPGSEVARVEWSSSTTRVPTLDLEVGVEFSQLIEGHTDRRSMQLATVGLMPHVSVLDGRSAPIVLRPRSSSTSWRLKLPEGWCLPKSGDLEVANELGSTAQTITHESADIVTIERESRIERRWIESDRFHQLEDLAVAENRSQRRRIRFRCPEAPAPDGNAVQSVNESGAD